VVLAAAQMSLGPALTQAREIFVQAEEAVVFALLQLARQLALQAASAAGSSHDTPATPSGMKPPFAKPTRLVAAEEAARRKGRA